MSPYHMALITSAIANGGKLMKPYLVDKVTNASGAVMKETDQEEYKQLMTEEEAAPDQRIYEERSRLRYRICIEWTELHSGRKDRVRQNIVPIKKKTTPGSSVCRMWKIRNWL